MKIGCKINSIFDFFSDYRKKSNNIISTLENITKITDFLQKSGFYSVDRLCNTKLTKNNKLEAFYECKECSQISLYKELYLDNKVSIDIDIVPVAIAGSLNEQLRLDTFSLKVIINRYLSTKNVLIDIATNAYVCGNQGFIFYDDHTLEKVTREELIDIFSSLHTYQYTLDSAFPKFYFSGDLSGDLSGDKTIHRLPSEMSINIDDVRTLGYNIIFPYSNNQYVKEINDKYFILNLNSREKINEFRRLRLLGLVNSNINTTLNVIISALSLKYQGRLKSDISLFFIDDFIPKFNSSNFELNTIFLSLNDIKIKYTI